MACFYWNNTHNQDIPYSHSPFPILNSLFHVPIPFPCSITIHHSISPFPIPHSPFPIPCSPFPIPYHHSISQFPIPYPHSPFHIPIPHFLFPSCHSWFYWDPRSQEPVINTVNTVAMAPGGFRDGQKPPATSLGSQLVPLHFNFRRVWCLQFLRISSHLQKFSPQKFRHQCIRTVQWLAK